MKRTLAALEAAVQARIPAVLVGAPGTGKTAIVKSLARKMGYELITLVGSYMDPTDIVGLPKEAKILETEDGRSVSGTVYLLPWWQVRILERKKVILLLDELTNTAPAVRASMLTMLQEREFPSGEKMPPETIVLGAMNPTEQAADGYELDLPTTNRLLFLPWTPGASSWYQGMLEAWGAKVSPQELAWRAKIVAFLKERPAYLHREPVTVETTKVYGVNPQDPSQMEVYRSAWSSRRTWDKLSTVLPHAEDPAVQDLLAQGLVGYASAAAFREWLLAHSSVSPEEVLEAPAAYPWSEASVGDANVLLRSVIELVDDERSGKVLAVFEAVADAGRADLGAPFLRDLFTRVTRPPLSAPVIQANKAAGIALMKKYQAVTKG